MNYNKIKADNKNEFEEIIIDFISGVKIKSKPEELEAVQVFSKQLVEDYDYPKEYIQTHPQYRVKKRPSDIKKEYPIDIAVFKSKQKLEDEIYIIVECKKKNKKDGKNQLENYLTFSNAYLGVWFNGDERIFLQKYITKNGEVHFIEIPNIPKFGQRIEDIGKFKRKDLKPTHNLKPIFKSIRNYLAGNNVGAIRDEVLAQQLINLIFCKLYDEKYTPPNEMLQFRAGINEDKKEIEKRIIVLFNEVKFKLDEIIENDDRIILTTNSIAYMVGELQNYCLIDCERDVIADAFETFIGHALKGGQGQFFTPRNVIKMMVEILNPNENDKIIDPACGSGGFLVDSLKFVWNKIELNCQKMAWKEIDIQKKKIEVATKNFRGIDKDYFLSKVAKAYMNLVGDGTTGIFNEDSLDIITNWKKETQQKIKLENFDIVLTNPPFGKNIKIEGEEKLKQFDVGYKWKIKNKNWEKGKLKENEAPEILFIERCLQLLKFGGRLGIVLPDGFFNENVSYLRSWILTKVKILAIIDIPLATFQPNTSTKTSLLFFEKVNNIKQDYLIFMAVANYCGHNRRGKEIEKNDLPTILQLYKDYKNNAQIVLNEFAFEVNVKELIKTNFWIPKHFSPFYKQKIIELKKLHKFVLLGEICVIKKGDEPGSENYIPYLEKSNTDIPFIRTSDLVNYSINQFSDIFLDENFYEELNQDIQPNDILYTKDGKIGITAMITENDKIIISSGIVRIRLLEKAIKQYGLTQEYIFAILSDKHFGFYQAIRRTVIAATIPHLREKRLAEFEIPILQKDKIKIITDIVNKSFQFKNETKKLDNKINIFFS